jgi:hypothetical protein
VILALLAASPGQAAAQYFPAGAFSERADLHHFVVAWYCRHLSAMDELSLLRMAEARAHEVYRFTWLRTFHAPFAFRLDVRPDGSGSLLVKSTSGKGGYDAGQLVLNKAVSLDARQVQRFATALDGLQFWNLPTKDPSDVGLDGAQWIFEGVKGGKYHVVDRWTPANGPFRRVMLDLAALSGITVEPVY